MMNRSKHCWSLVRRREDSGYALGILGKRELASSAWLQMVEPNGQKFQEGIIELSSSPESHR